MLPKKEFYMDVNLRKSGKYFLLSLLAISFLSLSAAEWRMSPVDSPFSIDRTGVNMTTIQLVSIEYNDTETGKWKAVTPSNIYSDDEDKLRYYYNESDGNSTLLEHSHKGFWMAKFKPNLTSGDMIKYNVSGTVNLTGQEDSSSGTIKIENDDINVGRYKVGVRTGIEDKYKAGETIEDFEAYGYNPELPEDKDRIQGASGSGKMAVTIANNNTNINNSLASWDNSGEYFYGNVEVPDVPGSKFLMHVEVWDDGSHGSYSTFIQTYPKITGEVKKFNSDDDCKKEEMVEICEEAADIDVEYNITNAEADEVNVTAYAFNKTSGDREYLMSKDLENESLGQFVGDIEIPDINTSKYMRDIEFKFNASNSQRSDVDRHNVTVEPFNFEDRSDPKSFRGEEYNIKLFLSKPYSLEPYNLTRFNNISVKVKDSSGNEVANISESELSYNEATGLINGEILVASDWSTGSYTLKSEAENIYNHTEMIESGFSVQTLDSPFNISDSEFEVNTVNKVNKSVEIENFVDEEKEYEVHYNSSNRLVLNNGTEITVGPKETDVIQFTANLTDMEDFTKSLSVSDEDTEFNKTINIDVITPGCSKTSGEICSLTELPINVSKDTSGTKTEQVEIRNLGGPGSEKQLDVSLTGEIETHAEVVEPSENLNMTETYEVEIDYTSQEEGVHTGEVVFETDDGENLNLETELNVGESTGEETGSDNETGTENGTESEDKISASATNIGLGYMPEGEDSSTTVEITNNGDSTVSIEVSSEDYTVSSENIEIEAGQTKEVSIVFEGVERESGTVIISAGEEEVELTVVANPVPNYKQKAKEELKERKSNLQEKVEDGSSLQKQLTDLSAKIRQIETSWESGNYEEAQTRYDEAQSTLETVSNQLNDGGNGGDGSDGNDGGGSSGGIPILPIAGGIIMILIIVFVALTSYVPEEGDPLYSILGE
jgi:hypothetical protein